MSRLANGLVALGMFNLGIGLWVGREDILAWIIG